MVAARGETFIGQILGLVTFKQRPFFPSLVTGMTQIMDPNGMELENIVNEQEVVVLQFATFGVCEPFRKVFQAATDERLEPSKLK